MVILTGWLAIKPDFRSRFMRAGYAMLPLSRAEAGCLEYNFYVDAHSDCRFIFVEKWASREALEAHFQTPHFKTFFEVIEAIAGEAPTVEIHTVSATEVLGQPAPAPATPEEPTPDDKPAPALPDDLPA